MITGERRDKTWVFRQVPLPILIIGFLVLLKEATIIMVGEKVPIVGQLDLIDYCKMLE